MKKDTLIILDFDHTVFNTTAFIAALKERFKKEFNINEETFMKHRNAIKDCCVVIDVDKFAESFSGHDSAKLHDVVVNVIEKHAPSFIFDDVKGFLEEHRSKAKIVLATHGDKELQTLKITMSDLPKVFSYHISTESKEDVVATYKEGYERVFFIDDKPKNIEAVKKAHPDVQTLFIKRPEDHPYGDRELVCECADKTITGLDISL